MRSCFNSPSNGSDCAGQSTLCGDGLEAVAYLEGRGDYADRQKFPFPKVIVTDLKAERFAE